MNLDTRGPAPRFLLSSFTKVKTRKAKKNRVFFKPTQGSSDFMVLESLMEKVFNPHSYFDRPGRSVYHALREVSRMTGIS